jgi:hypothetical protein
MRFNQSLASDADQKSSTGSEVDGCNEQEQSYGPNSNSGHSRSFGDDYDSSGTNECDDSNEYSFPSNRSSTNCKNAKGKKDSDGKTKMNDKRKYSGVDVKIDRKRGRIENSASKETSNHPMWYVPSQATSR